MILGINETGLATGEFYLDHAASVEKWGGGAGGRAVDTKLSYKTDEAKDARAFGKKIDRVSFDPRLFVYVLLHEGPTISVQAMRIAVEVVLQMAANYDAGMTHSEAEYEQGVIAARMRDGLAQFERKEP